LPKNTNKKLPAKLLACAWLLMVFGDAWSQDLTDYLTPALRAQVEKLKVDVNMVASNPTNLDERTRVLWRWANAYALSGGVLPVELTRTVTLADTDAQASIDGFIEEMTLLDEQPTALGTLKADAGPFEAGSFVSLQQTYTVGSRPLQTGAGILVARHFLPNYGTWQNTDPKADNYLSIHTTSDGVSFTRDKVARSGLHGGMHAPADALVFRVATGALHAGDQITLTYGDRSQGSRGFLMADFASDHIPLPLYVAFTAQGRFFALPVQPIATHGASLAGVQGFVPSVVASGEPFTLTIRSEDAFHNRATGTRGRWKISINNQPFREVPSSDKPITLLRDIELNEPGIYRFDIESADGRIRGTANPLLVKDQVTERIFWGDTHAHSGLAGGIGSAAGFMTWGRDDARLDFVSHSEQDRWLDDGEWELLRDNARRYTRQHEFIAFLGYEWSAANLQGGHHNVLFRTAENRERIPVQSAPTLSSLYAGLRASADPADILVIPQAHEAGDYRYNDPQLEHLVEIASEQGNFEWFGQRYLQQGHQIGFTAGSDNHLSQPGYSAPRNSSLAQSGGLAAVIAAEKTTDALFDAMKSGRGYATSGDRIIVDFSVNGTGMGQRGPFRVARTIRGQVVGTAPIDTITVMRNGTEIWQQQPLTQQSDKVNSEDTFLLSFTSASEPVDNGDNPRGWRHWRGTIEIDGATLSEANGQDFHNQALQHLTVNPERPNLIQFATITRGDSSSIMLNLTNVKRSTQLRIVLEPALETADNTPIYRAHELLEGHQVTLGIRSLQQGTTSVKIPATSYADRITLRRIKTNGEMAASFEFEDTSERQGDYYYVRIRQANDGLAWSSPVWVGGHPKR
jgi:hypothetical protein